MYPYFLLFFTVMSIHLLYAPQRIDFLRRAASEGSGPSYEPHERTPLTVSISAQSDTDDTQRSVSLDDATQKAKIWNVLEVAKNTISAAKYEEIAQLLESYEEQIDTSKLIIANNNSCVDEENDQKSIIDAFRKLQVTTVLSVLNKIVL